MRRWNGHGWGCIGFLCGFSLVAAAGEISSPEPARDTPAGDRVFTFHVRVIFGSATGFPGYVANELADMKSLLTENFDYGSYERSNTIRLSLFDGEEATALVFPEHYVRILPKGVTSDGRLRVKVELYHVNAEIESKTKAYVGLPPNLLSYQENEGRHSPVFPIAASALILTPRRWEVFGGVPVRVNTQGRVSATTPSTSPFRSPAVSQALGAPRYLILGIQMAEAE